MSSGASHSQPELGLDRAHPLREVWRIAWPTVLTMTSYTVMQFIDKLMVGQVSPLDVAAQGNGGIWAFTPIAVAFGFLTVVNTFVAQNLGAKTPERGPQYAWGAIWMSLVIWTVFLLPIALILPWVFEHMHDPNQVTDLEQLITKESGYGRILLVGGVVTLIGRSMHHYFFGLHRPKIITVSAIIGNSANVVLNYVLIFGEAGAPAWGLPGVPGVTPMGLYGAAWGTVLGTTIEAIIPIAVFLGPKMNRELKSRSAWKPKLKPIRDLCRIGWPAAVQYGNEIICWSLFMTVMVGKFGENHMTAGWIALGYMHLSFMPAVGFSVAVTSIVGKYIGAGDPDTAVHRARLGLRLAVGYMTVCGLLFFVLRYWLVAQFVGGDVTPEQAEHIIDIGAKLMICAAVFQTVDAFGIVYTGALRGAGDTVWPGVVTMIYSWLFIVAGGYAMIEWAPKLESVGPWIAAAVYIVMFGLTMCWRFESGRWRSIQLLSDDSRQEAAEIAPLGPGPPASAPDASVRDIAEELAERSEAAGD